MPYPRPTMLCVWGHAIRKMKCTSACALRFNHKAEAFFKTQRKHEKLKMKISFFFLALSLFFFCNFSIYSAMYKVAVRSHFTIFFFPLFYPIHSLILHFSFTFVAYNISQSIILFILLPFIFKKVFHFSLVCAREFMCIEEEESFCLNFRWKMGKKSCSKNLTPIPTGCQRVFEFG